MRQTAYRRPSFAFHDVGPVTKALCAAILGISLVASVTERSLGVGISQLEYSIPGLLNWELWRLFTYPFVERSPFGLILGLVVLWLFGSFFERTWGSRDFLRFFAVSCVGAGLIAIPLGFAINLVGLFRDVGVAHGPEPAIDAMLIAMALMAPNSNILFGFVLPIKAKNLIYILLGFELVVGIMTGAATLSTTLGGMAMGYLLVTGHWRPSRLVAKIRLWRLGKRRQGLYVVPPNNDKTLH